uniref:Uncharacterized protein n=1 Tax=Glossina pallidipes TaxID=7398 RepID=A0A1A9ZP51_GLOPL
MNAGDSRTNSAIEIIEEMDHRRTDRRMDVKADQNTEERADSRTYRWINIQLNKPVNDAVTLCLLTIRNPVVMSPPEAKERTRRKSGIDNTFGRIGGVAHRFPNLKRSIYSTENL